ncbi:hypothetical protein COHA_001414 [Chlorella ohadii]|uniref:Uncharacterized protein n=1 Tax=Chlorella ohadii TaxID=2649997 RepID=A0AAD5DYN4_9CHLO|nr:hypothetical protein COHA_001414 [Chlorella ohadii]
MAALLSDMRFGAGTFGAHGYADALAAEAVRMDSGPKRRPASPPQPVPQPWRHAAASSTQWEEALEVSTSPASSDATEQFLDCHSEPVSMRSSFEAESELLARGMQARLSVPETLAAAAAAVAPNEAPTGAASGTSAATARSTSGPLAAGGISLQQERQRRLAAEAAAAALRQQLDDISAALFSFRSSQGQDSNTSNGQSCSSCGDSASSAAEGAAAEGATLAAEVAAALLAAASQCRQAVEEAAAQRQRADEAAAAAGERASDAAYVARLVAGICSRAAAVADLESSFAAERASLERRLQQATRMGHAMLKHSKEAEPEPWKQQLLNTVVSVGCSILGAATAVLIIRRYQV